MKIHINGKQYEDTDIKAMTREVFLAEEIPNTPIEVKAKIYDQLTLDKDVFQKNVKDGMYDIVYEEPLTLEGLAEVLADIIGGAL